MVPPSTFFSVQFMTVGKEDLGIGLSESKRKLGVAMHFSDIIKQKYHMYCYAF